MTSPQSLAAPRLGEATPPAILQLLLSRKRRSVDTQALQ